VREEGGHQRAAARRGEDKGFFSLQDCCSMMKDIPDYSPFVARAGNRNYDRDTWRFPVVELKVRKIGNSLGVVLPKEVASRLHASAGGRLFLVEASDGSYRLAPDDPAFERKMAKVEDIMSRYRNTLRKLAE
jgi:putative addiction module antidote